MNNVQMQKCPNCDGPVHFDPGSGMMVCDFCGSEFELLPEADDSEAPEVEAAASETQKSGAEDKKNDKQQGPNRFKNQIDGFDFQSLIHQAEAENCENIPVYNCKACGAEILTADATFSLTCPFCGSNVILTDKVSGNLRPDGVIPFKITPDKLPEAVRKYYRKQKFIPKKFFTENVMGKITGIYVPFWVFDGEVEGQIYYRGEQFGSKYRSGDYVIKEYHVYDLERDVSLSFEGIPVDASEKMDDAMMDSIEPFDMNDVIPFDMRHLAGYAADRFDVPAKHIAGRARNRMAQTLGEQAESQATAGYSSARMTGSRLNAHLDAKYILMPVYQFDLEYNSTKYTFAVNGQTGKVTGNLPYDDKKAGVFRFLRFITITAGIFGAAMVKYLLGG